MRRAAAPPPGWGRTFGGSGRRVSSPSGSGSTLITSAPRSASMRPQVGPAMICASSTTLRPASAPGSPGTIGARAPGTLEARALRGVAFGVACTGRGGERLSDFAFALGFALGLGGRFATLARFASFVRLLAFARFEPARSAAMSASLEAGLGLGEEGAIAGLIVLGVEAGIALGDLLIAQGLGLGQSLGKLLVPAIDQGRSLGDAPRRGVALLLHLVVGDHAIDQALLQGLGGAEDTRLEQDLERGRAADEVDERLDLGIGHDQAEAVDRHAEARGLPADAQVAHQRDLQPTA